jgi:hypothetical protein
MGEPEHPENLHEIAEGDIAVAGLKILVGCAGKSGPAGHFRLRPVSPEPVLAHALEKQAHGFRAALNEFSLDCPIANHSII